jgi:hypothetical protein
MNDNKTIPPFYYLDGEILVRFIKFDINDDAIICMPNLDVPDTDIVSFSRLKEYKNIDESINKIGINECIDNTYRNSLAKDFLCAQLINKNIQTCYTTDLNNAFRLANKFIEYSKNN